MIEPLKGQTGYIAYENYDDETGALRMRQVYRNNLLDAPPDGRPSHAAFDEQGRPIMYKWHKEGVMSREIGPCSILFNVENGVHRTEVYEIGGVPRQESDGPHIINRNIETGEIVETSTDEDWYRRFDRSAAIPHPNP